jgi:uncharacterized protein YbjT (DUF2867 family)
MLGARTVKGRGVLALPFETGRTSPIAAADVAAVVAAVLRDPTRHVGAVYELTGPQVLDADGLAEQYGIALGRPITAENLSADDERRLLDPAGLPAHVQQHIATMARLHREDRYNRSTDDVERILGRPAQSVAQYVAEHRDLFD